MCNPNPVVHCNREKKLPNPALLSTHGQPRPPEQLIALYTAAGHTKTDNAFYPPSRHRQTTAARRFVHSPNTGTRMASAVLATILASACTSDQRAPATALHMTLMQEQSTPIDTSRMRVSPTKRTWFGCDRCQEGGEEMGGKTTNEERRENNQRYST